ncbi:MAG: hypothetical protein JWP91_3405 [Fibrobacteres bacterium]|nr:hypothetical protein [Fibrobacterota bacterium]
MIPGYRRAALVALACLSLAAWFPGRAGGEGTEPISQAFLEGQAGHPGKGPGVLKAFFTLLLGFYQSGISPADGPTCGFSPTCSGFARDAIRGHGLAQGILMTGDRVMRCNGFDKSAYPLVGPERHFHDPVP